MPILKRVVPEPNDIKDYRDTNGVYFEAVCDQCGRDFYPKRSTAQYCSKRCGIEARAGNILANPMSKGGQLEKNKTEKTTLSIEEIKKRRSKIEAAKKIAAKIRKKSNKPEQTALERLKSKVDKLKKS